MTETKAQKIEEALAEAAAELKDGSHDFIVISKDGIAGGLYSRHEGFKPAAAAYLGNFFRTMNKFSNEADKGHAMIAEIDTDDNYSIMVKRIEGTDYLLGVCSNNKVPGIVRDALIRYSSKLKDILN